MLTEIKQKQKYMHTTTINNPPITLKPKPVFATAGPARRTRSARRCCCSCCPGRSEREGGHEAQAQASAQEAVPGRVRRARRHPDPADQHDGQESAQRRPDEDEERGARGRQHPLQAHRRPAGGGERHQVPAGHAWEPGHVLQGHRLRPLQLQGRWVVVVLTGKRRDIAYDHSNYRDGE